jgi:hypothetical protein
MRYLVQTTETSRHIGSALTPPYAPPAVGWQSCGEISGHPGTYAITAPAPHIEQSRAAQASMGRHRSSDAPNVIFPSLYWYASNPQKHAPVSRVSDNQMPVPAVRPATVIIASPLKTRKGGQRQIVQPQVIQKFPGLKRR